MNGMRAGCGRAGVARLRPGRTLRRGFTLLELLIVISIIGLLFIWLIVALVNAHGRAKIHDTEALISRLKNGCVAYRETYGAGRDYPPMEPVSSCSLNTQSDNSSQNLYKYLCGPLRLYKGFANVTSAQQMPGLNDPSGEVQKPLMDVESSRVFNKCILDYWDRRLLYFSGTASGGDPFSGIKAHDQVNPGRGAHFDIVSDGPYATGKDPDGTDCRISTFKSKLEVE